MALLKRLKTYADVQAASERKIDAAAFAAFAAGLGGSVAGIRSLAIAPGGVSQFIHPIAGNEGLVGQDLLNDRRPQIRTDVQRAVRSRRVVLSGPFTLPSRALQLTARQAVYHGDTLWGLIAVDCDIAPAFAEAGLDPAPAGLELILLDRADHLLTGSKAVLGGQPVIEKIELAEGAWKLAAIPKGGWNAAIEPGLRLFQAITLAILLLMTLLIYFVMSYRTRLTIAVRQRTGVLHRSLTNHQEEGEQLNRTLANLRKAMRATLEALALAVESKEPLTPGHHRRVADLARMIAMEMGLPEESIEAIRLAAVVHDIGKISLPSEILGKSSQLSEPEFNLVKTHAQSGYQILSQIDFPWPIARLVWQHHERINGSGYPLGLAGKDILPEARILAVADVVEAMASPRVYRPALGLEKALDEIQSKRGVLYDPAVVDACLSIFREKDFRLD
jgi:putative nucleotidyltransferase with HDIG domain